VDAGGAAHVVCSAGIAPSRAPSTRYEEALARSQGRGDNLVLTPLALLGLGNLALLEGDYDQATARMKAGLAVSRQLGRRQGVALSLVGLAAVAAAQRCAEPAARLLGAADALRDAIGFVLDAGDRATYNRAVAAASAALGAVTCTTAWASGRAMPLEQAIAYALETPDAPEAQVPAPNAHAQPLAHQ
jgi:hypothetical protein